ncbi:unnamed protein product [Amoebophrya sp. A120]|nr:unnamed protein product [Amoebophrya sp. A120]|eukprot:GSA120T00021830001.1
MILYPQELAEGREARARRGALRMLKTKGDGGPRTRAQISEDGARAWRAVLVFLFCRWPGCFLALGFVLCKWRALAVWVGPCFEACLGAGGGEGRHSLAGRLGRHPWPCCLRGRASAGRVVSLAVRRADFSAAGQLGRRRPRRLRPVWCFDLAGRGKAPT